MKYCYAIWSNSLRSLWSVAVITATWSKINPLPICEAYFIATATSYSLGILHKSRKGFISLKERHLWLYHKWRSFLSFYALDDTKIIYTPSKIFIPQDWDLYPKGNNKFWSLIIISENSSYGINNPKYSILPSSVTVEFDSNITQEITQEIAQEITQENLSKKQKEILGLIESDPNITREAIAKRTGFSSDSVKYNLDVLKKKGILSREGSTKNGKWVIK